MKDSKDKEHRISDLKNMLNNMKEKSNENQSLSQEDYSNNDNQDYEIVDAQDMIDSLSEDYEYDEELAIDDEYIYNPNKESNNNHRNLEEDNEIDEDFIIKTNFEESNLEEDSSLDYRTHEEYEGFASEQFDNLVNAKIGKIPLMSLVSVIAGIIFIIGAIITYSNTSQRLIDNVVSGELNVSIVVLLCGGILLIAIGIYKAIGKKSFFKNLTLKMEEAEKTTQTKLNKPELPATPKKEKKPIKGEAHKIGEFDINEFKEKIPEEPSNSEIESSEEKLTEEELQEIEEKEYEKATLDTESIDDIFSDMEEIEDISQNRKNNNMKKDE